MTEAPRGSVAGAAFVSAIETLGDVCLEDPRARVPFDYSAHGGEVPIQPWVPSQVPFPVGATGPLVDAARKLRDREVSARELVVSSFRAADAASDLAGLVASSEEQALAEADALDAELASGRDRGPLHGIPITVKDVIDVAGFPTRAGSEAYVSVPSVDAVSVARLRAAGAIVLGKATTHEFALGVTTPQSRNPHDPSRIPGGSSGGSAICVVKGIGLASLGTDTRASIRVPAALSGAVGFKPTYGRVPTDGVLSLAWTMDHVAPLAKSVTDAALVMDALLGADSALAWTPRRDAAAMRVGVADCGFTNSEEPVAAAVWGVVDRLGAAGASIFNCKVPDDGDLDLAGALGLVISRCEAATAHRSLGLDRSLYWEEVGEQLDCADRVTAVDYLQAQRVRAALRDRLRAVFEEVDVIVTPTVGVLAPRVTDFARYLMVLARNAIPWSLVGFPAISVPIGTSGGLPIGIQVVGPPGTEARLVQVGREIEQLSG